MTDLTDDDADDDIEYCPRCGSEWSGTSCGLDNCGWIVGVDDDDNDSLFPDSTY